MQNNHFAAPHNMPVTELNRSVKETLRYVLEHTANWKTLLKHMEHENIHIASKEETLRKFVSIPERQLRLVEDLFRFYHFFHRTKQGRQLMLPYSGIKSSADRLIEAIISPAYYVPHITVPQDIAGGYLLYHCDGSHEELFVTRAICITSHSRGMYEFEETLENPHGARFGRGLHTYLVPTQNHFGVVKKARDVLQFISSSEESAAGLRLITASVGQSDQRLAVSMAGWLTGFDLLGSLTHRPVYVERISDDPILARNRACIAQVEQVGADERRILLRLEAIRGR